MALTHIRLMWENNVGESDQKVEVEADFKLGIHLSANPGWLHQPGALVWTALWPKKTGLAHRLTRYPWTVGPSKKPSTEPWFVCAQWGGLIFMLAALFSIDKPSRVNPSWLGVPRLGLAFRCILSFRSGRWRGLEREAWSYWGILHPHALKCLNFLYPVYIGETDHKVEVDRLQVAADDRD